MLSGQSNKYVTYASAALSMSFRANARKATEPGINTHNAILTGPLPRFKPP